MTKLFQAKFLFLVAWFTIANVSEANAEKTIDLEILKEACESIGFTPKTEPFGNCVLKLSERNDLTLTKIEGDKENLDVKKFSSYVCLRNQVNSIKVLDDRKILQGTVSWGNSSQLTNLKTRTDNFCKKNGGTKMDTFFFKPQEFIFSCKQKVENAICIKDYYLPKDFLMYSYKEKEELGEYDFSFIKIPEKRKSFRRIKTVQNKIEQKSSYNFLEDLLTAGLIVGGAYLLGNALSSPSTAITPSPGIINKIQPKNGLIYGPYDTPFGY